MSRTLRCALSLAQTNLAGPSRPMLRPVVTAPAAPLVIQRNASFFKNLTNALPDSWRRSMKKDDKPEEPKQLDKPEEGNTGSLFETVAQEEAAAEDQEAKAGAYRPEGSARSRPPKDHSYKSAYHKMSHRKLNDISRLVARMPVDEAILQLQFSEKRAAKTWVKSSLVLARDHAVSRGMQRDRLVVDETWVSKGVKDKRIDIKGRGRMGMKHHPRARIHFVLKEGKTWEQKRAAADKKALYKVRSAGMVREDGKLRRKMTSDWAW